ncbi:MAG: hypothetical protein JST67_06155 [Bacteroidetes bacterium]|nr:hypothetical protein [Bacteroidota bacterium]
MNVKQHLKKAASACLLLASGLLPAQTQNPLWNLQPNYLLNIGSPTPLPTQTYTYGYGPF